MSLLVAKALDRRPCTASPMHSLERCGYRCMATHAPDPAAIPQSCNLQCGTHQYVHSTARTLWAMTRGGFCVLPCSPHA